MVGKYNIRKKQKNYISNTPFIFEGFLLKDILQTNEESKQINKSRLDLNSFLPTADTKISKI